MSNQGNNPQTAAACKTRHWMIRYMSFLLDPGTLFTSRKAIATIKHNLVFSLGVLAIAVVLTVPGILTPVTGTMLHELSSIPVIANSMGIIAYGPEV